MMKIGIDVDEVLAELINPLVSYHNNMHGTSLLRNDFKTFDLWDTWGGTREEAYDKVYGFFHSDYFDDVKPVKDSQKIVNLLAEDNELVIITSRPDYIQKRTNGWINEFFPNVFSKVHFTHEWSKNGNTRKKDICLKEDVRILVEDSLDKALECVSENTKVFLFDCPWNQKEVLLSGMRRVKNWGEVYWKVNGI